MRRKWVGALASDRQRGGGGARLRAPPGGAPPPPPPPPPPFRLPRVALPYFSSIVTESIVIFSVGVERSGPVVGTSAIASITSRPSVTLPKIV